MDVVPNGSALETKPNLLEVLTSYPCPTTPILSLLAKRSLAYLFLEPFDYIVLYET